MKRVPRHAGHVEVSPPAPTLTAKGLIHQIERTSTVIESAAKLLRELRRRLDAAGTDAVKLLALSDQIAHNTDALAAAINYVPPLELPVECECVTAGLASNPATWDGKLPGEGELVVIPAGKHVEWDIPVSPNYAGIIVRGHMQFTDKDIELNTAYVLAEGGGDVVHAHT